MIKRYSIAEARDKPTSLIHVVEGGGTVELTRRGKPVAVVMALTEYQRLTGKRRRFGEAYQDFLRRNPDFVDNAVEPQEWLRDVRDPSPGKDFSW